MFKKFTNWFKKSNKNKMITGACGLGSIIIVIALIFCISTLTLTEDQKAEKQIPPLVNRYVDSMNKEDIDAYLDCVKLDDVTTAKNQSSLKIIFEVYDLKTTVKEIEVLRIDAKTGTGKVKVVTHITNQSKTVYQDCDNTTEFDLIYDTKTEKWYLGKSTLIDVSYSK